MSHTVLPIGTSYDQTARNGNHQGGNNCDQSIAYRKDGVGLECSLQLHIVLEHTYEKPGNDVDAGNQDASNRIALGKA